MKAVELVAGETRTLKYQLYENGSPRSLAGMTMKFAAKESPADTAFKIATVTGTVDDEALGKFSFVVTAPATPWQGVYEVTMTANVGGAVSVLSSPGGDPIRVRKNII